MTSMTVRGQSAPNFDSALQSALDGLPRDLPKDARLIYIISHDDEGNVIVSVKAIFPENTDEAGRDTASSPDEERAALSPLVDQDAEQAGDVAALYAAQEYARENALMRELMEEELQKPVAEQIYLPDDFEAAVRSDSGAAYYYFAGGPDEQRDHITTAREDREIAVETVEELVEDDSVITWHEAAAPPQLEQERSPGVDDEDGQGEEEGKGEQAPAAARRKTPEDDLTLDA